MSDKSFNSSSHSRNTRSNTDKTHEPRPPVLHHQVGQEKKAKQKKTKKITKQKTPTATTNPNLNTKIQTCWDNINFIFDIEPDLFKTKKPHSIYTRIYRPNVIISWESLVWEQFESELEVESDLFETSKFDNPFWTRIYRPIMADTKEDIDDDRTDIKDNITKIQLSFDNHAPVPPTVAVPLSIEMLNCELERLKDFQSQIDSLGKRTRRVYRGKLPAELAAQIKLNEDLLTAWKNATVHAHKIKTELQNQVVSRIKIPKAEPPKFDGNSVNWPAFLDQFNSMVVNANDVSPTDKLTLLKSSLEKGSAFHIVQNIALTDIGWTNAWESVNERYNNEREITRAHLDKLFNLTPMTYQNQSGIRHIIDTINEVVRALNNLNYQTDQWDPFLIHIARRNLDYTTRKEFEKSLPDKNRHNLKVMFDYLSNTAAALGTAGANDNSFKQFKQWQNKDSKVSNETKNDQKSDSNKSNKSSSEDPTQVKGQASTGKQDTKPRCGFCEEAHYSNLCPTILNLTPQQRLKLVGEKNLCKNCLKRVGRYHTYETCKRSSCDFKGCRHKHHALLHFGKAESNSNTIGKSVEEKPSLSASEGTGLNVILSTAEINIIVHNKPYKVRALVDQCSAVNIITEQLVNKLQLKKNPSSMCINGMGNSNPNFARGRTSILIQSRVDPSWESHLDCYILPEVTGIKPAQQIASTAMEQFQYLKLADETFHTPGPIDLILGCQTFIDIIGKNCIKGHPSAFETKLGYIIMGAVNSELQDPVSVLTCDVNFDLSRFWKQEEVPPMQKLSPNEQEAEDIFVNTCKQDIMGKFTVALPFKPDQKPLGESRGQAVKRLQQIEKKLEKYPEKKTSYLKAMNEYIQEGHVVEVPNYEKIKPVGESYYLPHHFVEKDSTSTKFRVVFDGSAKTSTGPSLNDNLLVGPCIQNDLLKTLLRFREHAIVFSADIRKMYLQIGIQESDQDFLRILWRNLPADPIKEYKFTVLPFGLSSSPFLAIRTLRHLAAIQNEKFPIGAKALSEDFYVDDCLTGANDIKSALQMKQQLNDLLDSGQFELRKWSSNHPVLLESIPIEHRETKLPLEFESTNRIKTLGILWNPATDDFTFKVILPSETKFTKRLVASYAAKTYDPTGLIQPVIIKAKIMLQELWESKIGWDEVIPEYINIKWKQYVSELQDLEHFRIPRHVFPNNPEKFNIHGFCDASKMAYGAVIYVVGISSDKKYSCHLLTAKSKVAPLRVITIPRLELLGAVILTRLMKNVIRTCRTQFQEIHFWSDSTIVLNQINKPSRRFKTFVGNRVSYIQDNTQESSWHYVKTKENPADLVSRGESPAALLNNKLWWTGPSWLQSAKQPIGPIPNLQPGDDLELAPTADVLTSEVKISWIDQVILKFNSLLKFKRVISLIRRRFGQKTRIRSKSVTMITPLELKTSMNICVKLIQAQYFHQEIQWLKKGQEFPKGNRIKSLNPFIDSDGLLKVGGRLREAINISEEMKHQILLPKNHHIVKLIIRDTHNRYIHAAPLLMMSLIRSEYWILGLKTSLNKGIKNCMQCMKVAAETGQQMMGNLPKSRISQARAFLHVGVDYAGPIQVLPKSGRGQRTFKSWIAVFVCYTTKAVHLELVSEMTTQAFIAALKRFVSRRGKPQVIHSDEGTNFIGSRNDMIAFQNKMEAIANHHDVAKSLAHDGIEWKLNPPGAPHMGGLWEAAVKSMKKHLKKATSSHNFTIEEMNTLLCEIEACLNSRPLTPISNDPHDFSALTPGHFLIGAPLLAIPGPDLTQVKMNRLDRWEIIQQQKTHFWNRWSTEYLHTLQNRPKWMGPKENFKMGDLVIIKDESLVPQKWKMGRIQDVIPGKDGQVRVVTVKTCTVKFDPKSKSKTYLEKFLTSTSILKRPIHKLVRLPYDEDETTVCDEIESPGNVNHD